MRGKDFKERRSKIITRLKEKRTDKKVTQSELADRLGTKQSRISELESETKLDVVYLLAIMEALEYEPKDVRYVLYGPLPEKKQGKGKNGKSSKTNKKK